MAEEDFQIPPGTEQIPTINVTPEPPEEKPFDINVGSTVDAKPPVDPDIASDRAWKANLGLPGLGVDQKSVEQFMIEGKETDIRKMAAQQIDDNKARLASETVRRTAGVTLTTDDQVKLNQTLQVLGKPTDPGSVFEVAYGSQYMEMLKKSGLSNPDSALFNAFKEMPRTTERILQSGGDYISKRQYLQTKVEDLAEQTKNQSWPGYLADQMKTLLPIIGPVYSELKLRGRIPDTSMFSGIAFGNNIDEQTQHLFSQPFDEFKRKADYALDTLAKDNPTLALEFGISLLGQSREEQIARNFFLPVDWATNAAFLKAPGLLRKHNAIAEANDAIRSTVMASNDMGRPSAAKMADTMGDLKEGAALSETTDWIDRGKGTFDATTRSYNALTGLYKAALRPFDDVRTAPSQEIANRTQEKIAADVGGFLKATEGVAKVEQVPAAVATGKVTRAIIESMKDSFPGLRNNIIGYGEKMDYDDLTKTWYSTIKFGKNDGTLHSSFTYAKNWAESPNVSLKGYRIVKEGNGNAVEMKVPLKIDSTPILDSVLDHPKAVAPSGWLNGLLGEKAIYRTADEVLAEYDRANRKAATYGPGKLMQAVDDAKAEIQTLKSWRNIGSEKWRTFKLVVNSAADTPDPSDGTKPYFMNSREEIKQAYQGIAGRLPDEQEIGAYIAMRRIQELTRMTKIMSEYGRRSNEGAMTHRLFYTNEQTLAREYSNTFDGMTKSEWPTSGTVLLAGKKGEEQIVLAGVGFEGKDAWVKGVEQGKYKVVTLYDDADRPLKGLSNKVGNQRIHHVVTENIETAPLNWQKVAQRVPKDSLDMDHPYYVKQGKVVNERHEGNPDANGVRTVTNINRYEGDLTIAAAGFRPQAEQIQKDWEQVRRYIREDRYGLAKQYVENNPMGMEWKDVLAHFLPDRDEKGNVIPALLDVKEPIHIIERGGLVIDKDKAGMMSRYGTTFRDGTDEGPAKRNQIRYGGQRDSHEIFELNNKGTLKNPVMLAEPAEYIDPIAHMQRSLAQMTHSYFLDDYKKYATRHWLESVMDAGVFSDKISLDAVRRSPEFYFHKAMESFKANPTASETKIIGNLKAQYAHINSLLGTPSEMEKSLHALAQDMSDKVYNKFGQKAAELAPFWLLPKITDIPTFLKAVAFHSTLGFFQIPQLLVQMQTWSNITSVAGFSYAAPGAKATFLDLLARINPGMIDALDNIASKKLIPGTIGWRPGEFKEANELFNASGQARVGKEVAWRDNLTGSKLVTTKAGQILDSAAFFFNEGERVSRAGANYTAYLEFRQKNPTGRLTNADKLEIMNRADDLSSNMTVASKSAMHTGAMTLPGTFLTNQIRLSELFMGKRTDAATKMRMAAVSAAMYGAPIATGLSFLPMSEHIRQFAFENGYQVGEQWYTTMAMEGIPAALIGMATGKQYNFGQRLGNPGFEPLREALRGDKSMWELAFGAPGSIVMNALAGADGMFKYFQSIATGERFPPKTDDVLDLLKGTVASANSAMRDYMVWQTGKWFTRKETYLGDADKTDALVNLLTGLTPSRLADVNIWRNIENNRKEHENDAMDHYSKEFNRASRAYQDKNMQAFDDHMQRAVVWLKVHVPLNRHGEAMERAYKNSKPLADKIEWDVLVRNPPKGSEKQFNEMLETSRRLRGQ